MEQLLGNSRVHLGYVYINTFSFGFVYGDADLSVDTTVSYRFHEDDKYSFSFGSTFEQKACQKHLCFRSDDCQNVNKTVRTKSLID